MEYERGRDGSVDVNIAIGTIVMSNALVLDA